MKRYVLIHYGEIGLKGENLQYFVKKLREFIKLKLSRRFAQNFSLHYMLGRFLLFLPEDFVEAEFAEALSKVPGIANFKFVYGGNLDFKSLGEDIWSKLPEEFLEEGKSFRVKVKRSMDIGCKSPEAEREIAAFLFAKGLKLKVDLERPDLIVDIEFFNNQGFFSFKKYQGMGGLSPGSQGKLVCLLSSGFDSPVAAYQMMKRGARVAFIYFHSYPFFDESEMDQVKKLAGILGDFQLETSLYLVPFGEIQRAIVANENVSPKYRVILYRRIMLRIAEALAKKMRAKGLVTGDSFGQVASQTPENLFAIDDAVNLPVYRPLISFDKEEIINISEKIATYDVSRLPCKDTCSMFTPKHPELKGNLFDARVFEEFLPVDDWVKKALDDAEIFEV